MARRNPMNERYQKHTAPAGKTRRSAAAAKPKRPDATGSSSPSKGSSAKKGRPSVAGRPQLQLHPPTPEYRFWRRIWLGLMVAAMALVGASFFLMRQNDRLGTFTIAATYIVLGIGLAIDFVKLRKLRMEWAASGGKLPAADKSETDDDAGSSANDKS